MEYTLWKYYCWSSCLPIILSHPHCQLTDGPSEVPGDGRGCPSGKNVLGVHPKFWVLNQATLRYTGSQTMDISGCGISLKSKIPFFQCEITNKAEHIRLLQKVNSPLHVRVST